MRLLMLLCLLCTYCIAQAQVSALHNKDLSNTLDSLEVIDIHLPDFHGVVDSSIILEVKKKWLSENFAHMEELTKIKELQWNMEIDNFYASGQSASYFGNGLYSNVRLEHRREIAGIPIGISGDLVLQNNRVNSRLSAIGIEFDHAALLEKYRVQFGKKAIRETFNNLSDEQRTALKDHFSVEAARQILLSEVYQSGKNNLSHYIDSLANNVEVKRDSVLLDSLKNVLEDIEYTEKKVDSLFNAGSSKLNSTQQSIQEWQNKVQRKQQEFEERIETGSLPASVKQPGEKRGWKSLLLNVSQFRLGSFRLRSSQFDIQSLPIHGIGMEIRRNRYYSAVSYGKEGRQRRQFPDYVRNVKLLGEGRTVLQVKAGIGMPEKSHLHLGFTAIRVAGTVSDSAYSAFPKRNVLISLDSRYIISKQFFVETTGSMSQADFTGAASTQKMLGSLYEQTAQGVTNAAGLLQIGWKDAQGRFEYTVGYQVVGSNFVTLGNLYLINNRNSIRVEAKQRFFQNRGQFKALYVKGTTNNTTEITPGIKQNQLSGELSYRLNNRGSRVWASYSPNFYLQNAAGSGSVLYQLNLATVGTQWIFPHGKSGQWISVLQLTNYADQSQYGDTSVVTGLYYGMLTLTYASNKYMVTGLTNVGLDQTNFQTIRDINIDVSQTFLLKNLQISQGVQAIKRFYGSGILIGGSGGIQAIIRQKLRLGIGGTYLVGLSRGEKNQFYLNSTAGWQF